MNDFREIQTDVFSPFAEFLVPHIISELENIKDLFDDKSIVIKNLECPDYDSTNMSDF